MGLISQGPEKGYVWSQPHSVSLCWIDRGSYILSGVLVYLRVKAGGMLSPPPHLHGGSPISLTSPSLALMMASV